MVRQIIITGTSRGIGRDVAELFLRHGVAVYGISRSPSDLTHAQYTHACLDITNEEDVLKYFASLRKNGVAIDGLVNNAGVSNSMPGLLTTADAFKSVLDTNLVGAFLMAREAIKLMKKTGRGRIVQLSSINVPLASKGSLAYSASKAALESLNAVFANEILDEDITLNTLGLSLVEGDGMVAGLSETALAEKQGFLSKPNKISVDEIYHALQFFMDDAAGNITNQVIFFGGVR